MNVEKGIILAASEGRRMRPLTEYLPKPLIPMGDKPLIMHSIEQLEKWGAQDIFVTLEPRLGPLIQHSIEKGYEGRSNVDFVYQQEPNGIGFSILRCQDKVGEDYFFVTLADEFQPGIKKLTQKDFTENKSTLLVRRTNSEIELLGNMNVSIDEENKRVVKVENISKVDKAVSKYHLCGLMVFSPSFFETLRGFEHRKDLYRNGEFSINHSIQHMIDSGISVGYIKYEGFYVNINTIRDLIRVYRYLYLRQEKL